MLKQIVGILLIYSSTIMTMDSMQITQIDWNPVSQPQAFFNELDHRIIAQVKSAEVACNQRDIQALTNHLRNVAALLKKAEEHAPEFQEAYARKNQLEGTLKRSQDALSPAAESLELTAAFRQQTTRLIETLTSITEGPITAEEWGLMGQVFKVLTSAEHLKKPRMDTDKK